MRKIWIAVIAASLVGCGNATNSEGNSPSPRTDETRHPAGVSNQNVISTDTAAMNVEKMHDTTGK